MIIGFFESRYVKDREEGRRMTFRKALSKRVALVKFKPHY